MNRLILVGNGFDLAHNLKTSYKDFISNYLLTALLSADQIHQYEDELIKINRVYRLRDYTHITKSDQLMECFFAKNIVKSLQAKEVEVNGHLTDNPFKVVLKSDFLEILLNRCSNASWVDIEIEFYKQLQLIFDKKETSYERGKLRFKSDILNQLNKDLCFLIIKLQQYLKSLPEANYHRGYDSIIDSVITRKEFNFHLPTDNKSRFVPMAEQVEPVTQVLNFNYTPTFEKYIKDRNSRISINYIHGQLDDPSNPLIFGFGDELDVNYNRLENETNKDFLEYIKSFWYLKTSNYHNLISFIDSGEFQVLILGHSCGLSDRTMLNMIFEHDNCRSIKVYYHQSSPSKNNFIPLIQEIARHFKDKGIFRRKVVNFERSQEMPQVVPAETLT